MLPRASCACVLLMAFGISCGGKATVDRARGNPVEPVSPSASSPQAPDVSIPPEEPHDDPISDPPLSDRLLMFVQDGEALSLAEVDLGLGALSSEFVALPHPASRVTRAQAWGTDIVHFVLADGTQSLEIRGNTWTTLAKALAGEVLTVTVSTTDSLIWTTLSVAKTPGAKKRVSAFVLERSPELKGRQLFAEREIDPHTGDPALRAFSPIGIYFRDTQGLMLQRSNAATPSLLVADASRSLDVEWAFASSILLVRNDSGALEWRTPDGNLIDVPGTAANHRHISGRIQLLDGRLSLLEDRKVRFIQPLTSVSSASNIVAVQDSDPSLVLAHESERWFFADTRGERASYTPALRTPCSTIGAKAANFATHSLHSSMKQREIVLLFLVDHECISGDELKNNGMSLDIWRFDSKTGESRVERVRDYGGGARPLFNLTESGTYAAAIIDGKVERLNTKSYAFDTLELTHRVLDWPAEFR